MLRDRALVLFWALRDFPIPKRSSIYGWYNTAMKLGYGRIGISLPFASKQMMATLGILVLPMGICLERAGSAPSVKTTRQRHQ